MEIKTDRGTLPIAANFRTTGEATREGYRFYFRNYDGNAIFIKTLPGKRCNFAVVPPKRTNGHDLYQMSRADGSKREWEDGSMPSHI